MEKPKKVTAILKVTENCNYNCEFCFYAHKNFDVKKNMDKNLCKEIIRKCSEYNYANKYNVCSVIFHGGEPLLRDIEFFKEIMEYENELAKQYKNLKFDNTIQTNGSLINDEWINFFKENNFIVGISLDGDETLNYHHTTNSNKESVIEIIKKYRKMDELGINVGLLSVITDKHSEKAKEFYDFVVNNKIKKLSILPCVNDSNEFTIKDELLIKFYKEFFDLYFYGEYELSIREFNDAIKRGLGYNITSCKNCHRIGCGSFLTFDSLGNVFFCDAAYDKSSIICNIKDVDITRIFELEKYIKQKNESMKFYNEFCKNCDIKNLCGGDCYRNDIILDDGKIINRFCNVSKIIYPYIKEKVLESIAEK